MITKSKAAVNTVLYVKNDDAGQQFLRDLRGRLNRSQFKVRLKGRCENRKELATTRGEHYSLRQTMPLAKATYFAVYLDGKGQREAQRKSYQYYWERIDALAKANESFQYRLETVRTERELLSAALVDLRVELRECHELTWQKLWANVKILIRRWWNK